MSTTYYIISVYDGMQNEETRMPIVQTSEGSTLIFHPFNTEETEEALGVELPWLGLVQSYSMWKEAIDFILEKGMGQLVVVSDYPKHVTKEDLLKELEGHFSKPDPLFKEVVTSEFFHDPASRCYFKDLN